MGCCWTIPRQQAVLTKLTVWNFQSVADVIGNFPVSRSCSART